MGISSQVTSSQHGGLRRVRFLTWQLAVKRKEMEVLRGWVWAGTVLFPPDITGRRSPKPGQAQGRKSTLPLGMRRGAHIRRGGLAGSHLRRLSTKGGCRCIHRVTDKVHISRDRKEVKEIAASA